MSGISVSASRLRWANTGVRQLRCQCSRRYDSSTAGSRVWQGPPERRSRSAGNRDPSAPLDSQQDGDGASRTSAHPASVSPLAGARPTRPPPTACNRPASARTPLGTRRGSLGEPSRRLFQRDEVLSETPDLTCHPQLLEYVLRSSARRLRWPQPGRSRHRCASAALLRNCTYRTTLANSTRNSGADLVAALSDSHRGGSSCPNRVSDSGRQQAEYS